MTDTAFDLGLESLSDFQKVIGASHKNIIHINRFTTPLGPMFACATDKGICLLEFTMRRILEAEFKDLCKRLNAVILPGENKHLSQLEAELAEYFSGTRKQFAVPLHTPGTPFQNEVWQLLQEIPYATTRSYQEQAIKLNKPKAVRAVASANGSNRIAIVIPCHRVIAKDGQLTGYSGGLERKQWLLDFEKLNA